MQTNKKVIIIFTSVFDLPEPKEVDNIILLLHRLKISLIIFGYEIGLSDDPTLFMKQGSIQPEPNEVDFVIEDEEDARTLDERKLVFFINKIKNFSEDMKQNKNVKWENNVSLDTSMDSNATNKMWQKSEDKTNDKPTTS